MIRTSNTELLKGKGKKARASAYDKIFKNSLRQECKITEDKLWQYTFQINGGVYNQLGELFGYEGDDNRSSIEDMLGKIEDGMDIKVIPLTRSKPRQYGRP